MSRDDEQALRDAIAGIDTALVWMEADLRRLSDALEAGISLEVYGELMRVLRGASE